MTDAGTTFDNKSDLRIGHTGYARVVVRDDAVLTTGRQVSGTNIGTGMLNVWNRGQFFTEGLAINSDSSASVSGATSYLQSTGDVFVAGDKAVLAVGDHASMSILAPSTSDPFNTGSVFVGAWKAGEASRLNVFYDGLMSVERDVVVGGGHIPLPATSQGIATVSNDGTLSVGGIVHLGGYTYEAFGNTYVEEGGVGELNVLNGGFVDVRGGTVRIHTRGELNISSGSMVVGNAPRPATGILHIANDGAVFSKGTIDAQVLNTGIYQSGLSPGDPYVNGDFTMGANGRLVLELGGITDDLVSQLDVNGVFNAAGTLELAFIDDFVPLAGELFVDLVSFKGWRGAFDQILVSGINPDWQYEPYLSGSGFSIRSISDGVAAVPGPSVLTLVALGLAILWCCSTERESMAEGPP